MSDHNLTPDQLAIPVATRRVAYDRLPMTCETVREILDEAAGKIINEFQIPNEEYAFVDAAISQAFLRIRDEVTQPFRTEQMRLLMADCMRDKMERAYQLSLELVYEGEGCVNVRDLEALFGEEVSDEVFGWADGLEHKYHMSRINGRCSLQATIDYDIAEAEKSVEEAIARFEELVQRLDNHATT